MNTSIHLSTPLAEEAIRKLRVNEVVTLSGRVFTARDMAHLKLRELSEKGERLPENFGGSVVFHAGPVARKSNGTFSILAIGPTTSIRMEPHSDFMGRLGVKAIVGKGGLGDGSLKAFRQYGMIYLLAAPGCGVLHAEAVKAVQRVHWLEEMGMPEAIWGLEVSNWGPLIVGMDSQGNSIFDKIREEGLKRLETLVKG